VNLHIDNLRTRILSEKLCVSVIECVYTTKKTRAVLHDTQTNTLTFAISGRSKLLIRVQRRKLMKKNDTSYIFFQRPSR